MGVEPLDGADSKQVVDFHMGKKTLNNMICKSIVQTLYKKATEFHECQTATCASKHPVAISNNTCRMLTVQQRAADYIACTTGDPLGLPESLQVSQKTTAAVVHSVCRVPRVDNTES